MSVDKNEIITQSTGAPIGVFDASLTLGPRGLIALQDFQLFDILASLGHERIPERVVHAKGGGAFGHFEVTHDITKYCSAKIFEKIGKRTPIAVRFSTVSGESGSADTVRDTRGFAIKFYTDDGNWDLVNNNTPVFFIRDPMLFPSLAHAQKRNPVTHLKDPNMFWDFMSLRPESTHQVCILFSDRGIPDGYRHMDGFAGHAFKLVNSSNKAVYCKFHFKTDQGIRNLDNDKAKMLAGTDPDHDIRDLYNAIAKGNYPSWTAYLQILTCEDISKMKYNPFDITKIWCHKKFPLIPFGKLILNRNPSNYFTEIEQLAFCPSHLVPGIEPSPDKLLHGRLLGYSITHRHRLGANFASLPVNAPKGIKVRNYQRDGLMNFTDNQGGAPNYFPNSYHGPVTSKWAGSHKLADYYCDELDRYPNDDENNFFQVTKFWNLLCAKSKANLVKNIAEHLSLADKKIQERAIKNFSNVHEDFGTILKALLNKSNT